MRGYDPKRQTWDEFIQETKAESKIYFAARGVEEAREIFAENPKEAEELLAIWENYLRSPGDGCDRHKIKGAWQEWRRLLGK